MDAEANQMCGEGNGRNGYRERRLPACVGTLTHGVPELRRGSLFPVCLIAPCLQAWASESSESGHE